jgi:hypothetical protein
MPDTRVYPPPSFTNPDHWRDGQPEDPDGYVDRIIGWLDANGFVADLVSGPLDRSHVRTAIADGLPVTLTIDDLDALVAAIVRGER